MHPYQVRYYKKWLKYERSLPCQVSAPRSLAKAEEPIESVELRAFRDASGIGVSAAVYAVIQQPARVNSGLVAAKSCLEKKGLTISIRAYDYEPCRQCQRVSRRISR